MSDFLLILLPGAMYFWVLMIGQGPFQEVLQERQTRVLPRLLACPVTKAQYILSKMLRCWVLCSLALVLLLVASALMFGVRWGNPAWLALVMASWALSMTGLLAVIFACVRTREQASVFSPMVLITFAMLGGGMFPYENLPSFLQVLGRCTPNRWAVLAFRGIAPSKPWVELAGPLAGLVAVGVLGGLLAFVLFGRQLSNGRRE